VLTLSPQGSASVAPKSSATITPQSKHTAAPPTPSHTPAPIFVSVTTVTSLSTTTVYTPLSQTWTGGTTTLLAGYCQTPALSLCHGTTTAYWAAVLGCVDEKPDCCPYGAVNFVSPGATEVVYTTTFAASIGPAGQTILPSNVVPSVATAAPSLSQCPGDYYQISGGCCPK
jgi:hypothetical protein